MNISIETESYNDRRYGKPWIAKVDFSIDKKGEFNFGDWIGSNGGKGVLEIEVEVGDIIARGQKDFRRPKNSSPKFYIVNSIGDIEFIGDKGEAYMKWKEKDEDKLYSPASLLTNEELINECKKRGII